VSAEKTAAPRIDEYRQPCVNRQLHEATPSRLRRLPVGEKTGTFHQRERAMTHAVLYQTDTGLHLGEQHSTQECAEQSVSIFEGAIVVGFVELLPEPVLGMTYALAYAKRNEE
jgi:hypothetical protein